MFDVQPDDTWLSELVQEFLDVLTNDEKEAFGLMQGDSTKPIG